MSNKSLILFPFLRPEGLHAGKILNKNLSKYFINSLDFHKKISNLNFQINRNAVKDYG